MPSPSHIADFLVSQRVVPVLRFDSGAGTLAAAECLREAGFRAFEITLTTPGAIGLLAQLRERLGPDVVVGAGTVLDADSARRCIDAGAQFLVSPCVVPGLAASAHENGLAALIGGFTPTEVLAAHNEGADIVKLFPASIGGPGQLAALRAVFPQIRFCPTGGVSLDNLRAWFAAGAALVGVGNNLIDVKSLAAGDRATAIAGAKRYLELAVQ